MSTFSWSHTEKKIARRAYDEALEQALATLVAEFKERAAAATTASDLWDIEDWLRERRKDLDNLFDYRYSRLIEVFAFLIARNMLDEERLRGLAQEKLDAIRYIVRSIEKLRRE